MIEQLFLHQQKFALELRKKPVSFRIESLKNLESAIKSHQKEIIEALFLDFKKPEAEVILTEIMPTLHEIRFVLKNLKSWTRLEEVPTPPTLLGTKSYIRNEPRGACLIIGPWNYPFQLMMVPLISALAAGNAAILKPSELTRHTGRVIHKIIQSVFSSEYVTTVLGGIETTQELLKWPFDHIFFTGSSRVGKIVMAAASKNLSSVTLELGGKSPTIVDSSAQIKKSARKIAWAKFLNGGQTCVAPDYVFVEETVAEEFKSALIQSIEEFYRGDLLKERPDMARMISSGHAARLKDLLTGCINERTQIIYGGDVDPEKRYVAPTLIQNPDLHSDLMKEEIFGPLLPLLTFKKIHEAIHFINEGAKPLALYIFSESKLNIETIMSETSSGGVCVNDALIHLANPHLPFGGVGPSGIGNYHGAHGFRTFSHQRAVLHKNWLGRLSEILYPPYTSGKKEIIRRLSGL